MIQGPYAMISDDDESDDEVEEDSEDEESGMETDDALDTHESMPNRSNPFSLFAAANYLQLHALSNRCLVQVFLRSEFTYSIIDQGKHLSSQSLRGHFVYRTIFRSCEEFLIQCNDL